MPEQIDEHIIHDLGMEELQRSYDDGVDVRKSLDTKSSTLLGFISVVITLLGIIFKFSLENNPNMQGMFVYGILITISMIFLAISLFFIIRAFQITEYHSPFRNSYSDIRSSLNQPERIFQNRMISIYAETIRINMLKNKHKADLLSKGILLLGLGVLVALISPLVVFWGRFLI